MLPKIRSTLKHTAIILLLCFLLLPWPISSASVYEEKDSAINYTMSYPMVYLDHNQEAQDRINSDIYNYIGAFRTDYYDGKFVNGFFKYEVKYEDDDVLSLMIIDYRYYGGAHGLEKGIGLNYSKKTGQRLPLSYFVRLRPGDISKVFSLPIYNRRNQHIPYRITKDFTPYTKDHKGITDNFYLMGNGAIALIYQPYELAPYASGITHIVISAKYVDYFNRRNHE
ncbi:DUF3298 and DUF4163 domain-containing protein [Mitsuokella jalaludinii]|uniref:DUF3298 and DUF4163 domain-containing protein n=1 Tax=Mitsuokella jalaludinii TaxID=187979 RepID=UPI00307D7B1F